MGRASLIKARLFCKSFFFLNSVIYRTQREREHVRSLVRNPKTVECNEKDEWKRGEEPRNHTQLKSTTNSFYCNGPLTLSTYSHSIRTTCGLMLNMEEVQLHIYSMELLSFFLQISFSHARTSKPVIWKSYT